MRDPAVLIRDWLKQPNDVPHEFHAYGNRLMQGGNTHAARYEVDGQQVVLVSTASDIALASFPSDVRLFGLNGSQVRICFEFFEREWMIHRGSRDVGREGDVVRRALDTFDEASLPLPPRLRRAFRGISVGYAACALLAFFDVYVPPRFQYAVPNKGLRLPNHLSGGTWAVDNFTIFELLEDAVAAKLISERIYIIDLHGDDEVKPPPPPPPSCPDDGPQF